MAKVRDYAWKVTCDLNGHVEIDFGDVWSQASDSQGTDGGKVVMQLAGQRMIQVGHQCLKSRLEDVEPRSDA